ncbi:YheT family hydrolase [Alkalimarinus alittae]|uniref:Alpha/beta fold hydrolase n=1 Tax=Alkalimarinus alittae TaxID=2961619 RepID=A0ABY6MYI2_9ALTE|nr:alpha/beta fold hydrolase [Alkalimarinus alittae]UZE94860.1 alpha/beta fold hydrolase [Alkalimarinus alittae]
MEYRAPYFFKNGHIQSIYPSLFRKLNDQFMVRERIDIEDGDFLDLDWCRNGARRLVIISHGLEGHSRRPYIVGMARALVDNGWDALAWNFRSCGGSMNRHLRFYHSGATEDLHRVVDYAVQSGEYDEIALVGFSMGGNLSLVYLGEQSVLANPMVKKAVVYSVPCDLSASAEQLAQPQNRIYMKRFLRDLKAKMQIKEQMFPEHLDLTGYDNIKNFRQFDDRYTAPIHGFKNAEHYWSHCSSRRYISGIKVPTLIVNAKDDPFLTRTCYPYDEVNLNPKVKLETPETGGHVGFVSFNKNNRYWSEQRAVTFLNGSLS